MYTYIYIYIYRICVYTKINNILLYDRINNIYYNVSYIVYMISCSSCCNRRTNQVIYLKQGSELAFRTTFRVAIRETFRKPLLGSPFRNLTTSGKTRRLWRQRAVCTGSHDMNDTIWCEGYERYDKSRTICPPPKDWFYCLFCLGGFGQVDHCLRFR